jgi:hypothetical protein
VGFSHKEVVAKAKPWIARPEGVCQRKNLFFDYLHNKKEVTEKKLDEIVQDLLQTLEDLDQPVTFNYIEQLSDKETLINEQEGDESYVYYFRSIQSHRYNLKTIMSDWSKFKFEINKKNDSNVGLNLHLEYSQIGLVFLLGEW